MTGFLGAAYLWVKAAHIIFVIFWIAGLFMLPRFYIYHKPVPPGSDDDKLWIHREKRLRSIIITPAMILVWAFGLMLAIHVDALSGYHGWAVGYGKKMAAGYRPGSDKALRWMNEIPGIATAVIVILVIVRPF
jgi:putative membrane protein